MGKNLKETIYEIEESFKQTRKQYDNIEDATLNDVQKIVDDDYMYDSQRQYIANTISRSFKSLDSINPALDKLLSEDEPSKKDLYTKFAYQNALDSFKNEPNAPKFDDNKTIGQTIKDTEEFFKDPSKKEKLNECLLKSYQDYVRGKIMDDLSGTYEKIEEFINEDVQKQIDEDFLEQKIIDDYARNDVASREKIETKKEALDEIIDNSKNKNDIELLNYLKTDVFVEKNDADRSRDQLAAERYPSAYKKILNKRIQETVTSDPIFNKVVQSDSLSGFNLSDKVKDVNKEEIDNYAKKEDFKFSADTKKYLKEALKYMDQMTDYSTGTKLFDINKYKQEEGVKIYGFKSLDGVKSQLGKAIDEKNYDEIIQLGKNYKYSESEMDELMKITSKLNYGMIPGNISLGRNNFIPPKYSADIMGTSKVNGLWHTLGLIKKTGMSIDKFVDNPIASYQEFLKKSNTLNETINTLGSKGDMEFLKKINSSTLRADLDGINSRTYNLFRGFESLMTADAGNIEHNYQSYQLARFYYLKNTLNEKTKEAMDKINTIDVNKVKNILINGNEEKDYSKLISDEYNYNAKLNSKDLDTKQIADTLTEVMNDANSRRFGANNDKVKEAAKQLANDIIRVKGLDCKEYNKLSAIDGKMSYKYYKEQHNITDIAPALLNDYTEFAREGVNKDNLTKICNTLKIADEQYNKRTIFGKWLRKEGRAERDLINRIKGDLTDAGIDMKDVDKYLKGEIQIDDMANKLEESIDKQDVREQVNIDYFDKEQEIENNKINEKDNQRVQVEELDNEHINEI